MSTEELTPGTELDVFTIRIVYKSGYTHDFDVIDFTISGGRYAWTSVHDFNKPLVLGVDEIAAIWQVGCRKEKM